LHLTQAMVSPGGSWVGVRQLHAINNLMDSVGVTFDHLHDMHAVDSVLDFHYLQNTRLDDALLAGSLVEEKRQCDDGSGGSAAACVDARLKAGLLSTYRYTLGKPRDGWTEEKEVQTAKRGITILRKIVQVKSLDADRARAAFVLGLTLAVGGKLSQEEQGRALLLRAIDSPVEYSPVGFLERFWAAQALASRKTRTIEDESKMVVLVEVRRRKSSAPFYTKNTEHLPMQARHNHI
jgi:hypothetical protein